MYRSKFLQELVGHKLALLGVIIIGFFFLAAIFAPLIAPHDPIEQDLGNRLKPGFWVGNFEIPMGTDQLGRCILSRIIYGTRISLLVGFIATGIMVFFGVLLGLITGYIEGAFDTVFMRFVDILLAFPHIILAIAIMAVLGLGIVNAMLTLGIVFTPQMIRLVRGCVLSIKGKEYVEAQKALGSPPWRILLFHVLPNISSSIIVFSALSLSRTILYIASLGFLGLGAQPPTPEWGAMISEGKDFLVLGKWWTSTFPGVSIALVTLGFVFLGHGIRDILDPRLVKV